jgi:hypothetical protein
MLNEEWPGEPAQSHGGAENAEWPKPPSSHLQAICLGGDCDPQATVGRRQKEECRMKNGGETRSDLQATLKRVDSQGIATPKPP